MIEKTRAAAAAPVALRTRNQEHCNSAAKMLREALQEAERGEINAVVIIARTAQGGGEWRHWQSSVGDFSGMIGKLEIVKQVWIDDYRKSAEK